MKATPVYLSKKTNSKEDVGGGRFACRPEESVTHDLVSGNGRKQWRHLRITRVEQELLWLLLVPSSSPASIV
jgi:hypothetical protein